MIETIYSNENGDGEGTSRMQPAFKMPKNVRQIGKSNAVKKVYIEDYVMSYTRQLTGDDYVGCSLAVLVGQCQRTDSGRIIFVSGAVRIKDTVGSDQFVFTNETWTQIYEDIKKYFSEYEIVGWFIGGPEYILSDEDRILKTHLDNFAGQDKVLLTYDNLDKEESVLCYENNRLCRQEGYYIYYDKNEEMQNYIIDHKAVESCESHYEDKVSRDIRTVIKNKQVEKENNDNLGMNRLVYAAGTLLAIIVLIIGAAMLRNYDQMKTMQDTLNYLSNSMEKVQTAFTDDDKKSLDNGDSKDASVDEKNDNNDKVDKTSNDSKEDGLDVEVVPGDVKPLKEAAQQNDAKNQSSDNTGKDSTDSEKAAETKPAKDTTDSSKDADARTKDNTKETKTEVSYYIVREGDTLADISYRLYHTYTKVDTIMELNHITDQDKILVGQKLIVP